MVVSKRLIPLAALENLMKSAGAERVSDSAKSAMKEVLEDYAKSLTKSASQFAMHAGRKTVKAEDIKLAAKKER